MNLTLTFIHPSPAKSHPNDLNGILRSKVTSIGGFYAVVLSLKQNINLEACKNI